jgi:hypothetical protein
MLGWGRAAFGTLLCALILTPHATAQSPVTVAIDAGDAAFRQRVDIAVREAAALYSESLGRPPGPLTITDGQLRSGEPTLRVHQSWRSVPQTMDVEIEVAFALARHWWRDASPAAADMTGGASWFLQGRAIARVFDLVHERDGHSVESVRLFGGSYLIAFPQLRFDGPAAGLGRSLLASPAQPITGARLPAGVTPVVVRVAHAFASLERLVGWPRLSGALRVATSRTLASNADVITAIGDALGQDVSWLFEPALDPSSKWSYAITGMTVEACQPQPCHRARVDVARLGTAVFSGRAEPRVGEFFSGDAIAIQASFDDGQTASVDWDGRDQARTFTFEGTAPVTGVRLDPSRVMLVDDNWLDQSRVVNGATNAPVLKWISRWVIWLQHAMLTYSAVV